MKKTAFLFPGQGSQSVGMGEAFYREYDAVRELFDMTEEITRINISKLCFKGPMEDLTMTVNLQPAISLVNLGCLAAIEKEYMKNPENEALKAALINSKRKKVEVMNRIIMQIDFANTQLY